MLPVPVGDSVEIELRWAKSGTYGIAFDSRNHGNPTVYHQNGAGNQLYDHEIIGPFKQRYEKDPSIVIGGNYTASSGTPGLVYIKARIIPPSTDS